MFGDNNGGLLKYLRKETLCCTEICIDRYCCLYVLYRLPAVRKPEARGCWSQGIIYAGVGDGSWADPVKSALVEARKQGVIIVRSSRVGQGIVARNGEVNDDD
jgi:hypothetical protein